MNKALNKGLSRLCTSCASEMRPARAWSVSARIGAGATWPATEITPAPPTAQIGRVSESSPDRIVNRVRAASALDWSRLPEASLIATMLGMSCSFSNTSGIVLVAVRPGTL
jgi:hypothetical protein